MSKTIEGIPEYLEPDQWCEMFRQFGFDPSSIMELRFAPDGVHALVFDRDDQGRKILTARDGYRKHRVFVPVRRENSDTRTTRITPVTRSLP